MPQRPARKDARGRCQGDVRQVTGRTVVDYINQMLLMEASFLLQTSTMKYTQIGNAVPCNLGKAVVKMVIDVLNGKSQMIRSSQTLSLEFD